VEAANQLANKVGLRAGTRLVNSKACAATLLSAELLFVVTAMNYKLISHLLLWISLVLPKITNFFFNCEQLSPFIRVIQPTKS
jgi:hypothetical protein